MQTFTAFANSYVCAVDPSLRITNLADELDDGIRLIILVEKLTGTSLGKYHKPSSTKTLQTMHKVENLNKVMSIINDFNKSKGIRLEYSAESVLASDFTSIMGMMWIIISKARCCLCWLFMLRRLSFNSHTFPAQFVMEFISEDQLNAKDALLLWCQRKTADYKARFVAKRCWE